MDMKKMTCCFSGHRDIPPSEKQQIILKSRKYIRDLVNNGVKYFGVGGALGYDTLAAQILFQLRSEELHHIKIILVYPFDGFTNRWTQEQQAVYAELLSQYDKIVCVADRPGKEAYLQRNRHLVNFSSYCVAYCTRSYGGTAYTLNYAKSQGVSVLNTAEY